MNKISKSCFFRAGSIRFAKEPPLSVEAKNILQSRDGEHAFRMQYGDYYVAGYVLGGDAGAFVSLGQSSRDTTIAKSVTASAKTLFFSKTWTKNSKESIHEEGLECFFCGYDTLSASQKTGKASSKGEYARLRDLTQSFLDFVEQLPRHVMQELEQLGIAKHGQVSHAECGAICDTGLVVQLVLMPFSCLRDYHVSLLMSA